MDLIGDIIAAIGNALGPLLYPPLSMIFITIVSLFVVFISTYSTKKFTDVEKLNEQMEEVKAWQQKFKEARKSMNPVLLQDVMDDQQRIMRIQTQMMGARMKPMCIFYIPFLIIFGILSALFGGSVVAVIPFNIQRLLPFFVGWLGVPVQGGFGIYYWVWYFITSASLGGFIRKLAHLDTLGSVGSPF
ncbi:MAG: EMC3/TMCO1 family protein [Candidatus Thorarchaeota archaeon]|nr:EMC3/TMCO1 family protein [Candidatus Thorarchaeota archaeon]